MLPDQIKQRLDDQLQLLADTHKQQVVGEGMQTAFESYSVFCNELMRNVHAQLEDGKVDVAALLNRVQSGNKAAQLMLVSILCQSILRSEQYDARARDLLVKIMSELSIPQETEIVVMLEIQSEVQQELLMSEDNHGQLLAQHTNKSKTKRYVAIGAGVALGGLAVGLTAGLAAPLVGVGLAGLAGTLGLGGASTAAFLAGSGGFALMTTIFGAAGASMTGLKVEYRSRGVSEFKFVDTSLVKDLTVPKQKRTWLNTLTLNAFAAKPKSGDAQSSQSSSVEVIHDAAAEEQELANLNLNDENADEAVVVSKNDLSRLGTRPPFVTIAISGWMLAKEDVLLTWQCLVDEDAQKLLSGECYSLVWETKEVCRLGNIVERTIKSEAVGYAATQVMKRTLLATLMAAVIWPMALLKAAEVVSNPWSVAMQRAAKTGRVLADVLMSRAYGRRPVCLVASSLGARVVFYCLREIYQSNCPHKYSIIHSVVLMGAPVSTTAEEWRDLRTLVAGRFVNVYSTEDWLLGFLYRAAGAFRSIAGIAPIGDCARIENVDGTAIVGGHASYRNPEKCRQLLVKCNYIADTGSAADATEVANDLQQQQLS